MQIIKTPHSMKNRAIGAFFARLVEPNATLNPRIPDETVISKRAKLSLAFQKGPWTALISSSNSLIAL